MHPVLLFDLDGTLVDSAPQLVAALSAIAVERGGDPVSIDRVRSLISLGATTLVRESLGPVAGDDAADLAAFRARLLTLRADAAMVFAHVREALEQVGRLGYLCAVVTNKPEALSRKLLADLALESFFQAVVGGDSLPSCKPSPLPLHHAVKRLHGSETGAGIMIGDSVIDAQSAAAAGMPFLLFECGYGLAPLADGQTNWPCAGRFASFAALPDIIQQM